MGVESYKHQFAKNVLASWLRDGAIHDEYTALSPITFRINRGPPHFGIWTEYPVCLDSNNQTIGILPVWDEVNPEYRDAPPTYDQCIQNGYLPICIFDVAIQHKGIISDIIEVVHKNGISETKAGYISRVCAETPFNIHVISADWVLSQVGRPKRLKLIHSIQPSPSLYDNYRSNHQ